MDNEQFTLIFNAICFFISVAGAIVSGFYYFEARKNLRAYKEEQEKKKKSEEYRKLIDQLRQK